MKSNAFLMQPASGCLLFFILIGVAGQRASAQVATSSEAPSAAVPDESFNGLEEIIVTARKRTERLQDVPVAITAFTHDDLARYETQSFTQIASQTPELQVGPQAGPGQSVITIRGIGTISSSVTNDQSVAVNIDGIQVSQSQALALGLHDLSQVEILKGPQALFFGKDNDAGVISLTSENPGKTFEAMARGGYEYEAEQRFEEGFVSGPLAPTVGARVEFYNSQQNGWFRNDAQPIAPVLIPESLGGGYTSPGIGTTVPLGPAVTEYFVRGTLTYDSPDEVIDARLKVSYDHVAQLGGYGFLNQLVSCAGPTPQLVSLLDSPGSRDCTLGRYNNQANLAPDIATLNPQIFRNGAPYEDNDQFLTSLSIDAHPSEQLTITSVTGFYNLKSDFDGNFAYGDQDFIAAGTDLSTTQISEELRATTSLKGPLNFMLGGYYQHTNLNDLSAIAVANPLTKAYTGGFLSGPILLVDPTVGQLTNTYSAFVQGVYDITRQLQFTAGARYSDEAKQARGFQNPNAFSPAGYDIIFTPNRRSFNNVSPETTLSYKPTTSVTFYGAYREGFKSGGFDLNALVGGFGQPDAGNTTYKQETAHGGEVGAKGTLGNRSIFFDFALYDYTFKDLQVSAFNPTSLSYQFTNAGAAETKGVDASIQAQPDQIRGLSVRATVNYNHGRYTSYTNSPCYTGQSQAEGCSYVAGGNAAGGITITPAIPTTVGNVQNLSGRPLANAPIWSGNVGATYEKQIGGGLKFGLTGDALYTGGYYALPTEDPRALELGTWRYNASMRLRGREDKWEVALIGTNLTNVLRVVSEVSAAGTGGGTGTPGAFRSDLIGSVTDPRAVTLQATLKF